MKIKTDGYALPIEKALITILEKELLPLEKIICRTFTFSFTDPKYSKESGGFHPVDIMIDAAGEIQYITDFAYFGDELAIEVDFDFSSGILEQVDMHYPIEQGRELFQVWQQNFCTYYSHHVYEVEITPCL